MCFRIPAAGEGIDFEDLVRATVHGCTECLDKLVKTGGDMNKTGEYNTTTLMLASRCGRPSYVNLLLAGGADLYMTDEFGKTALSHAADNNNPKGQQHNCAYVLLKAIGNNVNSSPLATETPLMSVAVLGANTWLKSLIEWGADINRTDMFGRTALMRAVVKSNNCTLTLLKAGADVNIVDKRNWTALKYAASVMNKYGIMRLLEAGAEVKDDVSSTYINMGVKYGVSYTYLLEETLATYRCTQLLLKIGAYINQASGKNALEAFIDNDEVGGPNLPVQELLLAAGNTIDESNKALLMQSILKSDEEEFSLKHLSREAVRKQMITAHPQDNLFQAVPKLGIPLTLESYLVYDRSVNDDDYSDEEHLEMWQPLKLEIDEDSYEDLGEDETEDANKMVGTDLALKAGNNKDKKDVAVQTDFGILLKMILKMLGREDEDIQVVVKEDRDDGLVVKYNEVVVNENEDNKVVVNEDQDKDENVNEMVVTDMELQSENNAFVPKKDVAVQADFGILLK